MSWTETSPGLYQRPLGITENSMSAVIAAERPIAREPIQIRCIANFTTPHPSDKVIAAFRDAWKTLRLLKSPDVATTFGNGNKYYKVPSPEELEAWLNETFTVAPTGATMPETVREIQLRIQLLPFCYILPQKTGDGTFKGTIILFISHWRTEASGAFKMLDQIFDYAYDLLTGTAVREALKNHKPGSEVHFLTPAIEDLLMPNKESSPEAKARVKKYLADFASNFPSLEFPTQGDISAPPASDKLNHRIYTTASTSSLASACRSKGISVTSAIHSAYISHVWAIADPDKRERSYACMMPAEVRKRIPTSSPFRDQGCWSASQMLLLTVPPGQDFLTRAQGLRQQYAISNQGSWLHDDMRTMSEQMPEFFASAPPMPPSQPWITSMGVLDRELLRPDHGDIMVDSVTVWADATGPGIVLGLWTFDGKLSMQISWNSTFHSEAQIQAVMDAIDKTFAEELGVTMETDEVRLVEC